MLATWHTAPLAVDSGAAAISALREAQGLGKIFPLILLDAQMPVMDGFALAESIKRNPHWTTATIMMLSSAGQRGDAKRCRDLGVDAYLTKPVRQSELLHAILVALGTRPAPQTAPILVTRHSLREHNGHLRILLVEDNRVNQVLAVRLLEKRGHSVTVAGNGNEALDANDWFANHAGLPRAAERHNDFGAFLGGPIVKGRSFFFLSYEGARLKLPQTRTTQVPSDDIRTSSSTPPQLRPFLNAYPRPNGPVSPTDGTAQFTGVYSNNASLNAGSVRIDHTFSDHFSIFGRFNDRDRVYVEARYDF
jgi:CheY-like chemotaxis protein